MQQMRVDWCSFPCTAFNHVEQCGDWHTFSGWSESFTAYSQFLFHYKRRAFLILNGWFTQKYLPSCCSNAVWLSSFHKWRLQKWIVTEAVIQPNTSFCVPLKKKVKQIGTTWEWGNVDRISKWDSWLTFFSNFK